MGMPSGTIADGMHRESDDDLNDLPPRRLDVIIARCGRNHRI
jgi:hypothetical protein